ncbi:hypothetical protein LTR50_007415 [Elasticomyces elasticus]|nr:hypothetical protein LTR50_007415 [Elasticomyces elasticus]
MAVLLSSAACTPSAILRGQTNTVCAANVRLNVTKHVFTGRALTLHNQAARWKVITTFDVLTEVVLVALPTYLVSRHEIKSGKKRIVIFVFSFRLIVAALFIIQTSAYLDFLQDGPSVDLAATIALQQILLCCSLIAASIPCLRSFLWAFMSNGLRTFNAGNSTTTPSHSGNVALTYINQNSTSGARQQLDGVAVSNSKNDVASNIRLRPDLQEHNANVSRGYHQDRKPESGEDASVNSEGSEQMIIRRNVEFEIRRD